MVNDFLTQAIQFAVHMTDPLYYPVNLSLVQLGRVGLVADDKDKRSDVRIKKKKELNME